VNRRTRQLGLLVLLASIGAWLVLQPLPWPARSFTTLLLVPLPILLLLQGRLVHQIPPDTEREAVYLSSALSIWALAALAMLAARFSDFQRADLRLVALPVGTLVLATLVTVLAGLTIMGAGRLLRLKESPIVHFLIPRSIPEKIGFVGLSISAGVAEELVFRSFLIAAIVAASGSMTVAVTASVIVFAVSHAYQGWTGAIRVSLLGLVLTVPFLLTGSVYPSILAHTALDLLAGLFLADWLTHGGEDND
jgi:uncharacterized protein